MTWHYKQGNEDHKIEFIDDGSSVYEGMEGDFLTTDCDDDQDVSVCGFRHSPSDDNDISKYLLDDSAHKPERLFGVWPETIARRKFNNHGDAIRYLDDADEPSILKTKDGFTIISRGHIMGGPYETIEFAQRMKIAFTTPFSQPEIPDAPGASIEPRHTTGIIPSSVVGKRQSGADKQRNNDLNSPEDV